MPDASWQAEVTVTLRQVYVKFFENQWLADKQADFSFLCTLYVLSQCVY